MNKRKVVMTALEGKAPLYVPWSLSFTVEARDKLRTYFGNDKILNEQLDDHFVYLGSPIGYFAEIGNDRVRDMFGVEWDRSKDKDIGVVESFVLPEPTLKNYNFPDPVDPRVFNGLNDSIQDHNDCWRVFSIGFSLYERAWTLRGMQNLMMDFYQNPRFVHELLNMIADYNILQINKALEYDIDAIYFGDDWGQQHGLQMGPVLWREFIYPVLRRMYASVLNAGKLVMIHSCGDVDELFDDLVGIGLSCFNPFQPEVMDIEFLMRKYRGRLAFHGGLSTQKTLPFENTSAVKAETRKLLELGSQGGYIFAPAHAVEADVPLENMLAFIDVIRSQPGYVKNV